MPYFPTSSDWTYTIRPDKIPLAQRFPGKYAVNSLTTVGNRHPGVTPRQPRNKQNRGPRYEEPQANPDLSAENEANTEVREEPQVGAERAHVQLDSENTDKYNPRNITEWN
jgi:hypothetical protein